jgi:LysR family transcriptional activator of glutamate synthase operon
MDVQQLRIFRVAATSGGFTRAGQQLNLSQSTVSQHMKQLEESLGCQLFLRVGKRVYLNDAGKLLLRYADKIFSEISNAEMAVREMNTMQRGTVRLGVGPTTLIYLLPRVLKSYRKKYPQIELIVSTASTETLIQSVSARTLDLAIVMQPVVPGATLQIEPIMREELVVVIDSMHELASKSVLLADDLRGLPFISYLQQTAMRSLVESYLIGIGVDPNITMEMENIEAIKSLVRAGLGAAVLPRCSVAGSADGVGLKIMRIQGISMARELCLALPKSEMIPMAIRRLAASIMKRLPLSPRAFPPTLIIG